MTQTHAEMLRALAREYYCTKRGELSSRLRQAAARFEINKEQLRIARRHLSDIKNGAAIESPSATAGVALKAMTRVGSKTELYNGPKREKEK